MKESLVLIDGSSLLCVSFFGSVPNAYYNKDADREEVLKKIMKTSSGEFTNGVYTMSKMLLKIVQNQKPTHMAVAWDLTRDTFRKKLYSGYKGTRDELKPELLSQFALMQDVIQAMGIPQYMHYDYEADDILGTLSKKFEKDVPTYIMTKDQDALQLVNDFTRVWLITSKAKEMKDEVMPDFIKYPSNTIPDNVFEFTPMYVEHFYGLRPFQIIDMKSLLGDTSDNIPGIKGIGAKSAIPLLKEYCTTEIIYDVIENLDESQEKEFKDFLKNSLGIARSPLNYLLKTSDDGSELVGKEAALLSKKLATIVTEMPDFLARHDEYDNEKANYKTLPTVDLKLEDIILNINTKRMKEKFAELEFNSLL